MKNQNVIKSFIAETGKKIVINPEVGKKYLFISFDKNKIFNHDTWHIIPEFGYENGVIIKSIEKISDEKIKIHFEYSSSYININHTYSYNNEVKEKTLIFTNGINSINASGSIYHRCFIDFD